jgi:hypothetical protein
LLRILNLLIDFFIQSFMLVDVLHTNLFKLILNQVYHLSIFHLIVIIKIYKNINMWLKSQHFSHSTLMVVFNLGNKSNKFINFFIYLLPSAWNSYLGMIVWISTTFYKVSIYSSQQCFVYWSTHVIEFLLVFNHANTSKTIFIRWEVLTSLLLFYWLDI